MALCHFRRRNLRHFVGGFRSRSLGELGRPGGQLWLLFSGGWWWRGKGTWGEFRSVVPGGFWRGEGLWLGDGGRCDRGSRVHPRRLVGFVDKGLPGHAGRLTATL
jgi:hypothetical protein